MSNSNNNRNRNKGGQSNQRRRRGRPGGGRESGGNTGTSNIPRGPVMTSLGESTYEAVFDHGNEGYGVWFDGMVKDDPVYKQNWKGNRPIFVRLEEDQIIISRTLPGRDNDQNDADTGESVPDIGNAVSVQIDFDEDDSPAFVMDPDPAEDLDDEASGDGDDRVYSPEEAAQLFAAEAADAADAAEAAADAVDAAVAQADAPAKPKSPPARRRVSTRKKKPAADADA